MEVPWRIFAGQHFFDQYPRPNSWQRAEQLPWIAMDSSIGTQATRCLIAYTAKRSGISQQ